MSHDHKNLMLECPHGCMHDKSGSNTSTNGLESRKSMKNRRSTIIVAILVTLVGTPRVWQEFGNILASLQHKTQSKLLSMAVNSQVRESNGEEIAATPVSEQLASCPGSKSEQVVESHKSINSPTPRKLKAQGRALPDSDESATLASNFGHQAWKGVALPRPEESLGWVGENQLSMHAVASVPPEFLDKSDVTEFVTLPKVTAIAPAWKISDADIVKLKKAVEEGKSVRQKVRYVIIRNAPALPST